MAKRRENMLEAFKASSEEPAAQSQPVEGASTAAEGGGLRGATPGRPGPVSRQRPIGAGLELPIGAVPFVVLQLALIVLVFSIGFLSGRNSSPVQAAGPATDESGDPVELDPRGQGPTKPRGDGGGGSTPGPARRDGASRTPELTAAERAFLDPANRLTIAVFSADDSEYGLQRATEVQEHLVARGFPAVPPRRWKGTVLVFVGASPTSAGVQDLLERIREVPGPDGGQIFWDAYLENIDKFR